MTRHADRTAVRLIDMIFPGDANHHGTLFGGGAPGLTDYPTLAQAAA